MKRSLLILITCLVFPSFLLGQTIIKGKVTDKETGEAVIGANLLLEGTGKGTATLLNGTYELKNVQQGTYTLRVSSIGYKPVSEEIEVGNSELVLNFELEVESQSLRAVEIFASRSDLNTPVAYSDISKEDLMVQLGSRDLPEVLNVTPNVYSTNQGGGAGDARINVRGFDQRNVAVMINGVPVNDMENGWVYWSNWDGVGDAARSIQVQRGISNVNLATPSVGGTINIITDPTANESGGSIKLENGSGAFEKTSILLNTGMIDDKFALSFVGVRKQGEGLVEGTWTDAWAYNIAAAYQINDKNRIDLYALGAPQRHGQNLYAQNIATYSNSYARDLDSYDPAALDRFPEKGRYFNQNVAGVNPAYDGKQFIGDGWLSPSVQPRFSDNFINERENFFHKPQVNLNWYSQLSEKLSLTNVLYYSGGEGGGTGTFGKSPVRDFSNGAYRLMWDETIARNVANNDTSRTILRNSRNNQWTIGDILKVTYDVSESFELQAGVDWRTAEIEHYREVRDLLGGHVFIDNSDDFNPNKAVGLGDKIAYNFTNTVDWIGGYLQGEYTSDQFSTYASVGVSSIKYRHENFFIEDENNPGNRLERESDNIMGYQAKGGALFSLNRNVDLYANIGAISKVPIFDNVIDDGTGAINEDPENEKFFFYEAGTRVFDNNGTFGSNLNIYLTDRRDRSFTRSIERPDQPDGLINITGLDQMHYGVELEMSYQPYKWLGVDFATSHNLWEYQSDVSATYRPDEGSSDVSEINLYLDGLKVGNAPQSQFAYTLNVKPLDDLSVALVGTSFMRYYSDFDPLSRDDENDRAQTWEIPNYTVFNMHVNYKLPSILKGASLFANIYNLLDETYIQDATDNSRYNGFDGDHDADDAEVFFGLPRRFNFGLRVNF